MFYYCLTLGISPLGGGQRRTNQLQDQGKRGVFFQKNGFHPFEGNPSPTYFLIPFSLYFYIFYPTSIRKPACYLCIMVVWNPLTNVIAGKIKTFLHTSHISYVLMNLYFLSLLSISASFPWKIRFLHRP